MNSFKVNKGVRFSVFFTASIILLAIVFILSLRFGANSNSFLDVFNSLFNYNSENYNEIVIRDIRFPRFLADLIVGASLAVAGTIMQGTTKNPMADSGIMGISAGSTLGVIIVMVFFPQTSRYVRIIFSGIGALIVTALIYGLAFFSKRPSISKMVLSGMAISTLCSSISTAIILKKV